MLEQLLIAAGVELGYCIMSWAVAAQDAASVLEGWDAGHIEQPLLSKQGRIPVSIQISLVLAFVWQPLPDVQHILCTEQGLPADKIGIRE